MARRKPGSPSGGTPQPASDIDIACEALQEIKRRLKTIATVGGGAVTTGLLLAAVDDCPEAVVVTNDAAEIVTVNGATARLTGLSTRALQSMTVWDVSHASSQSDFDVLWKEFLRAGRQRGHYSLRAADASAVEVAYCSEANILPGQHLSVFRRRGR